jgi:hypothetical protein
MSYIYKCLSTCYNFAPLVVGCLLAFYSGVLEFRLVSVLIGSSLSAGLLVIALETLKVVGVVYAGVLRKQMTSALLVPYGLLLTSLIALSLAGNVFSIGVALDRPQLASLQLEARRTIESRYDTLFSLELEAARSDLDHLEIRLKAEEHIQYADGRFRGPRYREYERLISERHTLRDRRLAELGAQRERELAEAMNRDYSGDRRTEHPAIASFQFVLEDTLGWRLRASQIVLIASALLGFMLELALFYALFLFGNTHEGVIRLLIQQQTVRSFVRTAPTPVSPAGHPPARPQRQGRSQRFYTHTRIVP